MSQGPHIPQWGEGIPPAPEKNRLIKILLRAGAAFILLIVAVALASSCGAGGGAKPPPAAEAPAELAPEETSPPNEPDPQEGREETEETETEPPGDTPPSVEKDPRASRVVVERIVDGDTIEVRGDGGTLPKGRTAEVRLLEIDAPEARTCYGSEATARTAELLPAGSSVRVERDKDLKDQYGRYLLYVWNHQETFVNQSLVSSGHAEAVLYQPNDKYWQTISQACDDAEEIGSGLWSACAEETETPAPPATPEPPATSEPPATPEPAIPDDSYPPAPPPGPDVDCSDLPGPVRVGRDDPHGLDRDGDGIGCDPN